MGDAFTRVALFVPGPPAMQAVCDGLETEWIDEGDDPGALQQLASVLDVYQLDEDPVLRSGQTFTPDARTPRRCVERWPDTQYPGGVARSMGDLVPVFVPALHAILVALEREGGAPLTKEQVETTRDAGACIMMEPRDLQKLEHSRGYADFDPSSCGSSGNSSRRDDRGAA
jgi:hypothetical protein